MDGVQGEAGELIERFEHVLSGLPELEAIIAATFTAAGIGGSATWKSPRQAGVVPELGTVGAALFIKRGGTVEIGPYLQLILLRLRSLTRQGVREDFLIRAVVREVTRGLEHLTNIERANDARADLLKRIELTGAELSPGARDLLAPIVADQAAAWTADLRHWLETVDAHLSETVLKS